MRYLFCLGGLSGLSEEDTELSTFFCIRFEDTDPSRFFDVRFEQIGVVCFDISPLLLTGLVSLVEGEGEVLEVKVGRFERSV
jgi:hypothetical protein